MAHTMLTTTDLPKDTRAIWLRRLLVAAVAVDLLCCSLGLGAFRPHDLPGTRMVATASTPGARVVVWLGGGYWPVVEFFSAPRA